MENNLKSPKRGGLIPIILIIPLISNILFSSIAVKNIGAEQESPVSASSLYLIQNNSLKAVSNPSLSCVPKKSIKMVITAYSSTVWQTDDTPFITAAGTTVRDGVVANNMLPIGTEIRIPELYGDKIFVVEDRMHSRKGNYHLDIWFSDYYQAQNFGKKLSYVEVVEI